MQNMLKSAHGAILRRTYTQNDHHWDCGKASQTCIAPDVFWTDADNIDVSMTADELTALEAAMQQNMVLQGFNASAS